MTDRIVYGFFGKWRFLSNFWVLNAAGTTNEHFFQMAKTLDYDQKRWVLSAATPGEAKRRGQQVTLREDWDDVRVQEMVLLQRIKFLDPMLRRDLIATGSMELVEANSWGDTFWGVDEETGRGENNLGKALMLVRAELALRA